MLPKRYGNAISAAAALQNRARCEAEAAPLLSSTAQRESQRPQGVRTRTPEDRSRAVVGASDTRVHSVRKCTDQAGIASLLLCRAAAESAAVRSAWA